LIQISDRYGTLPAVKDADRMTKTMKRKFDL